VQLLPYTWAGELTLAQRELARRPPRWRSREPEPRLAPQAPVASAEEHQRRSVTGHGVHGLLAQRDVLTIQPDMDAGAASGVGQ